MKDTTKIGEGSGKAFFRMGLRELRGAIYPDSNVAVQSEYGMYGTQTPGEIASDRQNDRSESTLEEEKSMMNRAIEKALQKLERQEVSQEKAQER
jgi:N-methylhydantoinase A/oxoprolinase/acetone carboxylase beta subunit